MELNATVITVELDVEIEKKDGGVYPGARLTYRGQDGKIVDQCFHNNTFKYNAALKKTLATLKQGDAITIVKEKKGEFWNVTEIRKGGDSQNSNAMPPSSTPPKSGGNWETPEERAKKQLYIIRQSSLGHAINLLASNGGKKNPPEEVISTAEMFVKYVMSGGQLEGIEALMEMEDDIPA